LIIFLPGTQHMAGWTPVQLHSGRISIGCPSGADPSAPNTNMPDQVFAAKTKLAGLISL
jgi:hypothetical protein